MFLDEPTSALDARSEQQMYQEFLAAGTGQTMLICDAPNVSRCI